MDVRFLTTLKTTITGMLVALLFILPVACTEPNIMDPTEPPGGQATELVEIYGWPDEQLATPASCDVFCGGLNFGCSNTCNVWDYPDGGTIGAGELFLSPDRGNSTHSEAVATCSDELSSSEGDVLNFYCCCEIPEQTEIEGDVENPATCDEVCAEEGLVCNPESYWEDPFIEGEFLEFATAGITVRSNTEQDWMELHTVNCDQLPSASPGDGDLVSFTCGCR